MRRAHLMLLLGALFAQACGKSTPERAFYYWKTTLTATPEEMDFLNHSGINHLYIKLLDVGVNPTTRVIQPYSLLEISDTALLHGRQWTACLFITNEVFQAINEQQLTWLAERTAYALAGYVHKIPMPALAWQVDCDWTPTTRAAFFRYLTLLRSKMPPNTILSATIRLHQFKFPQQTGVPPVDRGMLMAYNTGHIERFDTANSIYHPNDADQYWTGSLKPYPLPIDLALPVFSWTLLYREQALHKIIHGIPEGELADPNRFRLLDSTDDLRRFQVLRETFLEGHYLRPGDGVKTEAVHPIQLRQIVHRAATHPVGRVAFFHLDPAVADRFPPALIKSLCDQFHSER